MATSSSLRNTVTHLLKYCGNMKQLKQIHSQIITSPQLLETDRRFLLSPLLFFCALSGSGSLPYANLVFTRMHNPSLFVYNVMIRAYANKNTTGLNSLQPLILYKQMLLNGVLPDCLTCPFLLKDCIMRSNYDMGRTLHGHVVKYGYEGDVFVANSLISLYSIFGILDSARIVFDEMPVRDIVSWNSMIIGSLRCGDLEFSLEMFRKMKKRNIITWNSIITGFAQGGRPKEAIEFFHEMQILGDDMVIPDKVTIASVLSACASLGAIDHGKWVHSFMKRSGIYCDVAIGTALVDMYGKCGCVGRAFRVFNEMPKKDILAWTAMISSFAIHGYGKEAFDLFAKMEGFGIRPNKVTFIALLSACAHSGFADKARWCFDVMRYVYAIEPLVEHYACMVDVLSRAGLFEEAKELIQNMPMKPDVFVWGALLGGCLTHGNVELGERVAHYLIDLEPSNHAFYVTLSEIYAKTGRFEDVKRMRVFMNETGIKKNIVGCSTIEVDGVIREFSVRGSSEVFMEEILFVLSCLSDAMSMESYVFI